MGGDHKLGSPHQQKLSGSTVSQEPKRHQQKLSGSTPSQEPKREQTKRQVHSFTR